MVSMWQLLVTFRRGQLLIQVKKQLKLLKYRKEAKSSCIGIFFMASLPSFWQLNSCWLSNCRSMKYWGSMRTALHTEISLTKSVVTWSDHISPLQKVVKDLPYNNANIERVYFKERCSFHERKIGRKVDLHTELHYARGITLTSLQQIVVTIQLKTSINKKNDWEYWGETATYKGWQLCPCYGSCMLLSASLKGLYCMGVQHWNAVWPWESRLWP